MPTVVGQSFLAANLKALGERNADLGRKLADAPLAGSLNFAEGPQGVATATYEGRQLCSRHAPLDEAERLVRSIDLVEHAVVVVFGFGLGYHVQKLAERSAKATLIVVFEPDLSLLRCVLDHIDHSRWLADALVLIVTDAQDRGALAGKLQGAEAILAQGVEFLHHPSSRDRLADHASQFASLFRDFVNTAKTTLSTTLMRSVDTVRNLLLNLDHYAAGAGIAELGRIAAGFPAVIVSAGPSLHKNAALLAQPGVRDRCVIIAVQTALKPLQAAGVQPHFVTALDYHEISKRFYEDLDAEALRGTTLVAEPKAHPVILDSFPGPLRCCANPYLDRLLGPLRRDMGQLPPGATVAHLAFYLATFLGCNPVALVGQDLGFSDGLYYAPGTAIHDVWAPELNPFNTIAMMEWQRIVRHRLHLHKTRDVHGRSIYTDAQMHAYLQQFERDFAQSAGIGLTIIDATEGGVAKQHTTPMTLRQVLREHATRPLPPFPQAGPSLCADRLRQARRRIAHVRGEVDRIGALSEKTTSLLHSMLQDQLDDGRMRRHFDQIDRHRGEVDQRMEAFELVNQMNQMGAFKRLKADRRLHMQPNLDAVARQRAQLERDLENTRWIADAAAELSAQLTQCEQLLAGERPSWRPTPQPCRSQADNQPVTAPVQAAHAVAALVPIDPHRNGLGWCRSLEQSFCGVTVLQATLQRLSQSTTLDSIILLTPRGFDADRLISRGRSPIPIEIETVDGSPFGPEHEAIAVARRWADTCWRGGVAGTSVFDEVLCPQAMHDVLQRRRLSAALLVSPDWPLINVAGDGGCDALVRRHREHPRQNSLVFTQAPPGLCGCVISAALMKEFSQRNRLSTVGGLLVYQPHAPQHDPIARDVNVQIDHAVRRALLRATYDSPRQRQLIDAALHCCSDDASPAQWIAAIEAADRALPRELPQQLVLELTAQRNSRGRFAEGLGRTDRPVMSVEVAQTLIEAMAAGPDAAITLGGAGDPLLHPAFDQVIRRAKSAGLCVHVRTELLAERTTIDRLLDSGVDVISVDLHADRAATYQAMMGVDRFKDVLLNMDYVLRRRRALTAQAGTAAIALPWLVPHLQRRLETYEDIDSFFDRWQRTLGTAVLEAPPQPDALTPAAPPQRVLDHEARRCLTILSDGSASRTHNDFSGGDIVGKAPDNELRTLWAAALLRRGRRGGPA